MTINAATKPEAQHPPLARDSNGNLLAIPDGTSAWRLCRETTGRPREIKGVDRQPVRFPLDTTPDDVVEMCGADVYRVYALNEVGEPLVYITKWNLTRDVHELRNGSPSEALASRPTTNAPISDVRFVLEAMNQMMRTNSDSLRLVTDSHVDLAKVLASAKGMPRNLALPLPALSTLTDDDSDEDDDDSHEMEPNKGEKLMEFGLGVINLVNNLMEQFAKPKADGAAPTKSFDVRSMFDWQHAAKQGRAARNANVTSGDPDASPPDISDLRALLASLPIEVSAKLMQVRQKLEPDEQAGMLTLVMNIPKADFPAIIAELTTKSADEIVALFRKQLAELAQLRTTNVGQ